jgi:hypothetical protein
MGRRRKTRFVAAGAFLAVGLAASALVRRSARGQAAASPEREAFLDDRRERMRRARIELLAPTDRVAR